MAKTLIPEWQVWGEEREAALDGFRKQVDQWGLTMPQDVTLVLHFGLDDFRRTGAIEYWIVNDVEAGYCGKFLFVFDGQTCPAHFHKAKHETFFIVKGTVRMTAGGQERTMSQGETLVMPPGTRHTFTGLGNCLLLEVSLPSTGKDNYFDDERIVLDEAS